MGLAHLKPEPLERSVIEQLLEAANWAPSHKNTEPWRFTVFSENGREKLAGIFEAADRADQAAGKLQVAADLIGEAARKKAFAAPVWISIGMKPKLKEDGSLLLPEEEELMAVACSVQNMHLMARALGVAGKWTSKTHPVIAKELGLEAPSKLLGFFICGWPAADWPEKSKGPVAEKVNWIEF